MRTAAAAGADALLATDAPTDLFHPETVRGSVGTLFHVPVAQSSATDAVARLRRDGVRIVVATPDAPRTHWDADFGERNGVSRTWLDAADDAVSIPMAGAADSLNVAVAAGVVLFEAVRQREASVPAR